MYLNKYQALLWGNVTLLKSDDDNDHDPDSDEHHEKPPMFEDDLPWHVLLGIGLVSFGIAIVLLCIAWSCVRKYCCPSAPAKIGRIKVIVRQPSVVSLGDDSNQRTWVTTTSLSKIAEPHPSIFQVLPALHNTEEGNKGGSTPPPPYSSLSEKKSSQFLM